MQDETVWKCKCVKCYRSYGWKDNNNKPIKKPVEPKTVKDTYGFCDECLDELLGVTIPLTGLA